MKTLLITCLLLCLAVVHGGKTGSLVERGIEPRDIIVIDGVEYYASSTKNNLVEAIKTCNDFGMKLVTLDSQEKNEAFRAALDGWNVQYGSRFWLSGRRQQLTKFLWAGTGQLFGYTDWATGQPIYSGDQDACVYLNPTQGWLLTACMDINQRYLCEKF